MGEGIRPGRFPFCVPRKRLAVPGSYGWDTFRSYRTYIRSAVLTRAISCLHFDRDFNEHSMRPLIREAEDASFVHWSQVSELDPCELTLIYRHIKRYSACFGSQPAPYWPHHTLLLWYTHHTCHCTRLRLIPVQLFTIVFPMKQFSSDLALARDAEVKVADSPVMTTGI